MGLEILLNERQKKKKKKSCHLILSIPQCPTLPPASHPSLTKGKWGPCQLEGGPLGFA